MHGTMGIECMNAGNQSEIKTLLHAGIRQEISEKRIAVNAEYDKETKELDDIVSGMAKILRVRQQAGELSEQLEEHLKELKIRKETVYAKCAEIKKEQDHIEKIVAEAREAKIKIAGNINRGVTIGIDSHEINIDRDTSFMEYTSQNGIIVGTVVVI